MTVTRTSQMVSLLAVLLAAGSARAEPVGFTFEQSIYQDAKEAPLRSPEGVACSDTALVVADTGNKRLLTFKLTAGRLSLGTEVKLTQLTYPTRLQLDSKGGIVALDGKTRKIVRMDPKGVYASTVEVKGVANASSVIPGSFKLDASDALYLLDVAGRRVLVLDAGGTVTRQLELPKAGEFTDLAVDLAGTIFVVDGVNAALWSAERNATAFAVITKGMKDKMNFPVSMLANKGKLFLVDQYGNGVVTLGIDGSYQGRQLAIGWNDGTVYYPSQLCITEGGEAFLADRYNNRVQYFTLAR
jgi:sugar lactone lactonase YvrE